MMPVTPTREVQEGVERRVTRIGLALVKMEAGPVLSTGVIQPHNPQQASRPVDLEYWKSILLDQGIYLDNSRISCNSNTSVPS